MTTPRARSACSLTRSPSRSRIEAAHVLARKFEPDAVAGARIARRGNANDDVYRAASRRRDMRPRRSFRAARSRPRKRAVRRQLECARDECRRSLPSSVEEIHRTLAEKSRDGERAGRVVDALRFADILDAPLDEHREHVADAHRLDVIVRDVENRAREALRERR